MHAETLARALAGRRTGSQWMAHCPAHEDRKPSFSIRDADDGNVLVHCHAGCDQSVVINKLRSLSLWDDVSDRCRIPTSKQPPKASSSPAQDDRDRIAAALRLWHLPLALPAASSPVEIYLRSRGISLAAPSSVRFHPCLKHPNGGVWPGMVALVTREPDGQASAIHRTFLTRDGTGKAPVCAQKMMLGPCSGGAVRLAEPSDVLMIGEGIETCLAAMQETGHSAWAALSTSGLRALDLPKAVRDVIVLADGDDPGEAAARDCALRWKLEGRRVRIARPPKGMDFNDMLVGRASSIEEGAR